MPRLVLLAPWNIGLHSHHCSVVGGLTLRVAHEVGTRDRLDLDHVGAEEREQVPGRRAGPPRGEVEDAHAVEGERGASPVSCGRRGRVRRSGQSAGAVVLAERGRGANGRGRDARDLVRDARLHEPARRRLDEAAARLEVVERR